MKNLGVFEAAENIASGLAIALVLALWLLSLASVPNGAQGAIRKASRPPGGIQMAVTNVRDATPVSYEVVAITAYDFAPFPQAGTVTGTDDDGNGFSWATGSSTKLFVTPVPIPAGAIVDWVGLRYCDSGEPSAFGGTLYDVSVDGSANVVISDKYPGTTCATAYNPSPAGFNWDQKSGHSLVFCLLQEVPDVGGHVRFDGIEVWYTRQGQEDRRYRFTTPIESFVAVAESPRRVPSQ